MIKRIFTFDNIIALLFLTVIITCGIVFKQQFIKILPCCVSIFVLFFLARANGICFILGAVNSLIYSFGYFNEKLYGTMLQALIVGVFAQIIIYIKWRKNNDGTSGRLKSLKLKNTTFLFVSAAVLSGLFSLILRNFQSKDVLLDSAIFILGLYIVTLQFFSYSDHWFFGGANGIIVLTLWCMRTASDIASITYLFYGIYNCIKIAEGIIKWSKIIKKQAESAIPIETPQEDAVNEQNTA